MIKNLYFAGEVLDLDAVTGGLISRSPGRQRPVILSKAGAECRKRDKLFEEDSKNKRKLRAMGYNVAIDGPAGAGKVPLQSWLQKKKDTFMLILVPCTAGLQYIF